MLPRHSLHSLIDPSLPIEKLHLSYFTSLLATTLSANCQLAATDQNPSFIKPSFSPSSKIPKLHSRGTIPFSPYYFPDPSLHHGFHICFSLPKPDAANGDTTITPENFISQFLPNEPRKGSDVLVEALKRQGFTTFFVYLAVSLWKPTKLSIASP